MAHKIREIANENNVPLVENAPLARGLYYKTREGQMIAPEFLQLSQKLHLPSIVERESKFKKTIHIPSVKQNIQMLVA